MNQVVSNRFSQAKTRTQANGLTGSFMVRETALPQPPVPQIKWYQIGGIIAILVLGIISFFLVAGKTLIMVYKA